MAALQRTAVELRPGSCPSGWSSSATSTRMAEKKLRRGHHLRTATKDGKLLERTTRRQPQPAHDAAPKVRDYLGADIQAQMSQITRCRELAKRAMEPVLVRRMAHLGPALSVTPARAQQGTGQRSTASHARRSRERIP
jgi:hypothetical protein